MPLIELKDFNLGGLADSAYQGLAGSLYRIVGMDLHSEPGVMKVNQALVKESGSTIDDFVKTIVPCSDGNTYLFGATSGKIWKRTSGGSYSLEATASPAAGNAGILWAEEFNGYIYYAMQSRLGRVAVGSPTSWAGRNDSWATFTVTDDTYHPMIIKNLELWIADGYLLAQVDDGGTFTANALDLETQYRISSIGETAYELILGTYIGANVRKVKTFRYNTWSSSWSSEDVMPEIDVSAFLDVDNFTVACAGRKGNIYSYNGSQFEAVKRIPGDWSSTNRAIVHGGAHENFDIPLFGLSNDNNNPALQGVYSYGSYSANYPRILNLEYVISQNKTSSIEIGAIKSVGDNMLVSWKDGSTYGVDKIDWSNKLNGAYVETRVITLERSKQKTFKVNIGYRTLPGSTDITLQVSVNGAAYAAQTLTTDATRNLKFTELQLPEANTIQFKIITSSNGNNAPEIENVEISY